MPQFKLPGQLPSNKTFQLLGWGMFIMSALFFTASTLRARDVLGVLGSLWFLAACFVFLLPLLRESGPQ
ncbi:MAG: hypothetical protein AAF651_05280 [Cyanobacteria bacterium P01_C01_bin.73]